MSKESGARINLLMEEVTAGVVKRDTMKNSSYEFSGETQAMYFSVLRNNMESDMAYAVMNCDQEVEELGILKEWGIRNRKGSNRKDICLYCCLDN